MTRSLLTDAFGHHTWATIEILDACRPLTAEQLDTTVPGTYGSIIETLRHLVGGDASYLFVLTGGQVAEIDEAALGLEDLRAVMVDHGPAWVSLVDGAPDPDTTVTRHRDDGIDSHAPMSIRIVQALHHGTDHRSQICTALTALGIEPPDIDVWAFADKDGRLSEVARAT
jgi:uncharacterized damage-inducible protein DinB